MPKGGKRIPRDILQLPSAIFILDLALVEVYGIDPAQIGAKVSTENKIFSSATNKAISSDELDRC